MRDLAFRRHQDDRARNRARRTLQHLFSRYSLEPIPPRLIHRHAIDRTPCSCPLCGNPRRYLGEPTIQERRQSVRPEELQDHSRSVDSPHVST